MAPKIKFEIILLAGENLSPGYVSLRIPPRCIKEIHVTHMDKKQQQQDNDFPYTEKGSGGCSTL